ncbi:rRNA biogenesis protein rrp5 [Cladophialophora chaetospira]|uniref:rRNA biogenesis protein rrp5 n=1 Tax=Cladophialophora chaetospira TaxID=386627 RepID=A0AA39CDM2_9EURO|nr:rRNA biogenesis protein rrp5 [Cladophialophora chaetospira]
MASAKRKSDAPSTKQPNKRPKTDSSSTTDAPAKQENKQPKTKAASLLTKEQPAFPRGGASLLTPLERKQIRAKAARDADREQKPTEDLFGAAKGTIDTDSDNAESVETEAQGQDKKKDRKRTKGKKQYKSAEAVTKAELQIGGLSYKRTTTGSLILGQITSISPRALTVALPNNLVGYVPLTAISPQLSQKIESLLDEDQDKDSQSDEDEEKDDDIDLKSYFRFGQYLRVAVTSTEQDRPGANTSARKRIELSVEPALTNIGIDRSNLATGATVQVSVNSVEDHGLVVELALEDDKIRGFVPRKQLPDGVSLSDIKIGAVLLCHVLETSSNNKVVKLSADFSKASTLKTAPAVDTFLPGTKAEILLDNVTEAGLAGKIMGLLDVTADVLHSGSFQDREAFRAKFQIGKKVSGRLICNFPLSENKRLGFSVLDNVLDLSSPAESIDEQSEKLALSSIVKSASVISVEPGLGVYLRLDEHNIGFAHVSRLSDKKLDAISEVSGSFKLGSEHKTRVLEYNPVDNLYIVSLQKSILQQPFLRFEDVPLGAVVQGTIEKLVIGANGVTGLLVTLADGVTGFVPKTHMSDVNLDHPEKKFREGQTVTARVLSCDPSRRRLRLTLKKALVNSDQKAWLRFDDVEVGNSTVGTLAKVDPLGAVVRFYGPVKGFLPVSEMSEAYIKDARDHFRVGQVVSVNALSVDAAEKRMTLSCRDITKSNASIESSLSRLLPGTITNGIVFEKSENDILLRLEENDAIARLTLDHIADGSLKKRQSAFGKIRVNQKLESILILQVQTKRRLVLVSNKQSLVGATRAGTFLKSYEQLQPGAIVTGYVKNITEDGVFVGFAAGISGLINKTQVPVENEDAENFSMTELQPVTAKILNIDYKGATPRFWLTMREVARTRDPEVPPTGPASFDLDEPVDGNLTTVTDFSVGMKTKARVISVKETQINVELAKDVQGRIDVSEVFDDWKAIKDRKRPLRPFYAQLELTVRVLGAHDTRNHRFLPLTHRKGKNTVFELTCKPSSIASEKLPQLTLQGMTVGSAHLAFINNISDEAVWVNISPSVRGRIRAIDLSDDLSLATNIFQNFPLGSALRVRVLAVDAEKGHLDLTARSDGTASSLTFANITQGLVLPGRVTKITDHNVIVQLGEQVAGSVELLDMADDYNEANPAKYHKNDVLRVCVVSVDVPNKKVSLSTRPSKVLSSSMKVVDREITTSSQVVVNDIVRGFIKNVSDKGIFVALGRSVTSYVRVSNLSDSYIKEWKDSFQRDQLVKGRIIMVDEAAGNIQMSLKESALKSDYKVPLTFNDLKVGDVVTGKVVNVEPFGVFVLLDNSEKIRGLCHRSEIAEQRVEDASKLFNVGDKVKAKVLKLDAPNRKVNFGMKASYFGDTTEEAESEDDSDKEGSAEGGAALDDDLEGDNDDSEENDSDAATGDDDGQDQEDDDSDMLDIQLRQDLNDTEDEEDIAPSSVEPSKSAGLSVGGFDWTGLSTTPLSSSKRPVEASDSEAETPKKKKSKKHRAAIEVDHTGDLDVNNLQSPDDFERLLVAEPDSSNLWLRYMAFHLNLGDVDAVRALGERALRTIGLGLEEEKLDVWIALLNLEVAHGDDDTVESTFKRALEVNDPQEIYTRLASIYISSGKFDKADDLFQTMLKKFAQDPKVWVNYASSLMDKGPASGPEKARALLPRALQTLPKFTHFETTLSFALLEFKSKTGLAERGRTIFEGLISSFPKKLDLFNVLLDLEIDVTKDDEQVRAVFERVFGLKLKAKQARSFFKKWERFEQKRGDERRVEEVRAKAAEWVRKNAKTE